MIEIYNEDCLKVLERIEDNSVDLICSDVPYPVTARGSSGNMGGYWKSDIAKSGKIFKNNAIKPCDYLPHFYRILKDKTHCYIMINNLNLQEMLNEATKVGFHFVKCLICDKQNKICGRYYMNQFEYICLFRKGGDRPINNCGTSDILSIPIKKLKDKNGNNLHDTEKPIELMKILVENSTNEGDTVIDPFMGIGSCGIACKRLNRNFIGCEIDPKYFEIAKKRINQIEYQQQELF
jgi:site-specific DNA-methyltransferase (adenine-specific)